MSKVDLDALKKLAISLSSTGTGPRGQSVAAEPLARPAGELIGRALKQTMERSGIDPAALRERLLKQKSASALTSSISQRPQAADVAQRKVAFQRDLDQRRTALRPLGPALTTVNTSMVFLPEPFFITVSPNSSYTLSNLTTSYAPYDSRAQIGFVTDNGATVNCDFWFYWVNDSDYQVLLTSAASQTVMNGYVMGSISGSLAGLFGHFEAFDFSSGASLTIYQGSKIAVSSAVPGETFDLRTHVEIGVDRSLNIEYQTLTPSTSGWPVAIPPQSVILISVAPYIAWEFLSGWAISEGEDDGNKSNLFDADFNDDDLDYGISCSGVALQIQSPVVIERTP